MLQDVFAWLKQKYPSHYGGCVPTNYLCLDVETTGGSKEDLVVSAGQCRVVDGVPQGYEQVILNWFDYDNEIVPNWWLEERLNSCRYQMEKRGNFHGITVDRMREEGIPVREAIDYCTNQYLEVRKQDGCFAGHCMVTVDAPRLAGLFE